jgi:hypothetical protein
MQINLKWRERGLGVHPLEQAPFLALNKLQLFNKMMSSALCLVPIFFVLNLVFLNKTLAATQADLSPGGMQPSALEMRVIQMRNYETDLKTFSSVFKEMCGNGGGSGVFIMPTR